ncbi:ArsR/SmtB family transcription factor [Deinococcus sonorensis]|uniref:Helix-turn-helix domain-containing protein n=2 Tax=Deinococcus sonorensis TaxID=309891 RepID=A0AAU7U4R2_9DEIO
MAISGNRVLHVDVDSATKVFRALSSETRVLILGLLSHNVMNVSELTAALNLPHSTVSSNIKHLEEAGLLHVEYMPGTHGTMKLISKRYDEVLVRLPGVAVEAAPNLVEISMPIGTYRHIEALPTCGLASDTKYIGMLDDPRSFFEPDHVYAQILWFRSGSVEYAFPNNLPYGSVLTALEFSAELCSEAPQYDPDWPSDITLWINDVEVGTWTSPGDFGGVAARLTPAWWPTDQTTHGVLKVWRVTEEGSHIDGEVLSGVRLGELSIPGRTHISVRLGVKPDARNPGGMNLFGRRFGNYPQDLTMRLRYTFPDQERPVRLR